MTKSALLSITELAQPHYSIEDLVSKTGKTEKYVRNRLKLCTLPENARTALAEGKMLIGVAELVGRLPNELQEKATDELLSKDQFGLNPAPITFADARDLLLERYTLRLADAPFSTKDAELSPEAGACSTCPKRTGNQGVLFADVKSPDVGTDPNCYGEKKERTWKLRVVQAKEQGTEVLTKKEAKQVFGFGGQVSSVSGFVEFNDRCEADPKGRTLKKLLGKNAPPVVLARDQAGRPRELVKATDLPAALEAAGHRIELPKAQPVENPAEAQERRRKERERQEKKRALIEAAIPLAVGQLVEKWEKKEPSKALWRLIAQQLLDTSNGEVRGRRREQLGETMDEVPRAVEKMTEPQLRALVFELALEGGLYESWGGKYSDGLAEICELMKVDLKTVEKEAKTAIAAAANETASSEDHAEQGDAA